MSALGQVEDEVRELVRRRGIDPVSDPTAVRRLVDEVVADYDERSLAGTLPAIGDLPRTARQVYDAVAGLGPLQPYLDDPTIEEIWITSDCHFRRTRSVVHGRRLSRSCRQAVRYLLRSG